MPKFFQKDRLASACATLATLTGLLASVPAQAVSLSQNGQGQVLLFPYYTVRGGNDTYLSLLNSSNVPTKVMVRFRASTNSVLVFDFELFLAPHDQWTGGVTATADGAKLISSDQSCTRQRIPASGLPFYVARPGEGVLDITREGSFEVFELGEVKDPAMIAAISQAGGPPSCTWELSSAMAPLGAFTGSLSGTATLINVAGGTQYSYEPVALENFSNETFFTNDVTLDDAQPPISQVLDKGRVITSTWTRGVDAVSAVLMHASINNEFVLEPTTLSGTDWVVTLPTKNWYQWKPGAYLAPFAAGTCQYQLAPYDVPYWSREAESGNPEIQFGTSPPATPVICNDVSVLTFNNANLLGSIHGENLDTSLANGWAEFKFEGELVSLEGHRYKGLPVTGFMVHDFVNGNVGGLLSNYGGNFNHKYSTDIEAD
ncbi:MAG: hypothetical protein V4812_15900 [Pseudomonadota bacterium]